MNAEPMALQVRSANGSLPLRCAVQAGASLKVIELVARSWLAQGLRPVHFAATNNCTVEVRASEDGSESPSQGPDWEGLRHKKDISFACFVLPCSGSPSRQQ